jgi:hypothetical protein
MRRDLMESTRHRIIIDIETTSDVFPVADRLEEALVEMANEGWLSYEEVLVVPIEEGE